MNTEQPGADPTDQTARAATDPSAAQRLAPRSWSIVWGVIVLVVCVFSVAKQLSPESVDPTVWVIATALGLGVLLLAAGIAVVARGRRP